MVQSPKSRALLPSRHCKQTYSSDADRLFKISPTKAEVQHQQKTNFRPTCDGRTPLSAAETSDSTQESCSVSPISISSLFFPLPLFSFSHSRHGRDREEERLTTTRDLTRLLSRCCDFAEFPSGVLPFNRVVALNKNLL